MSIPRDIVQPALRMLRRDQDDYDASTFVWSRIVNYVQDQHPRWAHEYGDFVALLETQYTKGRTGEQAETIITNSSIFECAMDEMKNGANADESFVIYFRPRARTASRIIQEVARR